MRGADMPDMKKGDEEKNRRVQERGEERGKILTEATPDSV